MIDIEYEVFDKIAKVLRNKHGAKNIYVTGESVRTPSKFPCVSIAEIENGINQSTLDSSNEEKYALVFYEVNVYSNKQSGKKAECKALIGEVDIEMMKLGFIRTMTNPIENEDPSIYRIVSRYRAVAGSDNKIYRG